MKLDTTSRDSDEKLPEWAVMYFNQERVVEYLIIPCIDGLGNEFFAAGATMRIGRKERSRTDYDTMPGSDSIKFLSKLRHKSKENAILEIEEHIISYREKDVKPKTKEIEKVSISDFKSKKLKLLTFENQSS
jgi:hypothetical protein